MASTVPIPTALTRRLSGPEPVSGERGVDPGVQVGWIAARLVNALLLGGMAAFAEARLAPVLPWPPPLGAMLLFAAALVLGVLHARRL